MADRLQQLVDFGPGRMVVQRLGLPQPAHLRRYEPGQPLLTGPAIVGGTGRLIDTAKRVLSSAGARHRKTAPAEGNVAALVFDATALKSPEDLKALYDFFSPLVRRVDASGRVLVLGTPPAETGDAPEHIAQRSLEGFVRSLAKELRRGATAQLVHVSPGAEDHVESTLRFLLSARSAYVDAQVVHVGSGELVEPKDWDRPLDGRTAVVTGAARGIGAAIAEVLSRDGAHVVCLDVAPQGAELAEVANRVGGSALQLDITASDAPERLVEHLRDRHGGVDVVVHNAGITRDRTLGRMSEQEWSVLLDVNLAAPLRLTSALLDAGVVNDYGRVIGVSSLSGIAGNRGQTNYAASKAGIIGMVEALAPTLAPKRTINAVAPGFIETKMTAAMPLLTREAGRRLNSLSQGGQPVDVAETVAWLASPASGGVNGNVVRVCGQSLLGA